MRKLMMSACCVAALTAAALVGASAGHAQEYPWCAEYGGNHGGTNCGFVSYQQCLASLSGNGGSCTANPLFRGHVPGDERVVVRRPVQAHPN
jgi:hypothetical protein